MQTPRVAASFSRGLMAVIAGALVATLGGCGEKGPGATPAGRVLEQVADTYAAATSFSERTRITKTVSGADGEEASSYRTELYFQRPNRVFYEITGEGTMVIACDGERLIVYSSERGGYAEQEAPEDLAALLREQETGIVGLSELALLAGSSPHESLADAALGEDATLDGRECRVVTGSVQGMEERGAEEPATASQTLWIGKDDNLIHKSVVEIKRGEATLRIEEVMEELALDPILAEDRFEYEPPKGAIDLVGG